MDTEKAMNLAILARSNNSNAAGARKPLVLSSRLSAAADLSRYGLGYLSVPVEDMYASIAVLQNG